MKRIASALFLALIGVIGPQRVTAQTEDVAAVMRMMPADWTLGIVVVNFERFDQTLASVLKKIQPDGDPPTMLADIKGEIGVGNLVDFSKPVGLGSQSVGGQDMPVIWAKIPDAAAKIKAIEGAKEDNGVWVLGDPAGKQFFVRIQGEYAVVATDRELLAKATRTDNPSLADEVKSRMDLLTGRDVFIHFNFDGVREAALQGVAQFSQMAPMIAMMAAQQGGGADPAAMLGAMSALADASKKLVEQLAYMELTFGLNAEAGRLTLATGYKEGNIKEYLSKQKPAAMPLLTEIQEQPHMLAMSYHVPGGESPFFDYVMEQMEKGSKSSPMGAASGGNAGSGQDDYIKNTKELFTKVEGLNVVASYTQGGMRVAGNYVGDDTKRIMELAKETIVSKSNMAKGLSGGMSYEPAGTKKIGDVDVEQYSIKIDESLPQAAQAKAMVGENTRMGFGIAGNRVRFCMGDEQDMQRTFEAKVTKPLASAAGVKESLAGLPAKHNGVALIDLARVGAMIGTLMGMPAAPSETSAPPVAIAVSLSGHPARLDVHVPLKAVEQLMAVLSPKGS